MRVGFCSPLPPARTGVADYSAALLAEFRRLGRVKVNPVSADIFLYHIGNNELHREIYWRALREPGVTVLHDAVLHHFLLGTLGRDAYVDEFAYNYGEWRRGLAEELWAGRARSAQDPRYFEYPMLRRLVEASRATIVHNPAAARMARQHVPGARIHELPFLFSPPPVPAAGDASWLRRDAGIPPCTCVIGVFGHLRESKRLMTVLKVFERLRRSGLDAVLIVAGPFGSSDLERAAEPWLKLPRVMRFPYTPAPDFWRLAAITDICVNLRYPAAGETSAIGIPFMGIGKTVVLSAGEETSRFPDSICVRVDSGPAEEEVLAAELLWLARDRSARDEIGRRAAAYVRRTHDAEAVAQAYWRVLDSAAQDGPPMNANEREYNEFS